MKLTCFPIEILLKDTDWQYDDELHLLREDIHLIADQLRADETKKMVTVIERSIKRQVGEPVEVALARPKKEMWDEVLGLFKTTLSKAEDSYLVKAKSELENIVLYYKMASPPRHSYIELSSISVAQASTAPKRKT